MSVGIAIRVTSLRSVAAQTTQPSPSIPVRPNEGAVIGRPDAASSPAPRADLQCQGCHAPGKQLPYLAGSLFHNQPHEDYDKGFHAKSLQTGSKAASCVDCHARNRDLSTMLPASDPRSTINRANIAETCGRCHADKS
ncbi:MAG TPA: hypothetical protein VIT19_09275, partial [Pyrinomonadaceae bacterium]